MSSDVFDTIAASHPEVSDLLPRFRSYLSTQGVGSLLTADRVADLSGVDLDEVVTLLAALEGHTIVQMAQWTTCRGCEQPLATGQECDVCDPLPGTYQTEGYELISEIAGESQWYTCTTDLLEIPEGPRRVLLGMPRFIHSLHTAPPRFISDARGSKGSVNEADYRDATRRAVSFVCGADAEVKIREGFSDLVVRTAGADPETMIGEFKVWGRNDYRDVVNQLISYFTGYERFGFVFMVNQNQAPLEDKYVEEIILPHHRYVPGSLERGPILGTCDRLQHYRSMHRLDRVRDVEIFHFLFDLKTGIL